MIPDLVTPAVPREGHESQQRKKGKRAVRQMLEKDKRKIKHLESELMKVRKCGIVSICYFVLQVF